MRCQPLLADRPAYRTYLQYCMLDSDRTLCGFSLCKRCNVLNFLLGRRIESFDLPPDQLVRRCMLFMHSTQELGRHLHSSDQEPFDILDLPNYIDGKRFPQARVNVSRPPHPRSTSSRLPCVCARHMHMHMHMCMHM